MTLTAEHPDFRLAEKLVAARRGVDYGYGYKLADAGNYGMAVSIDTPDIDESRMSLVFPFADGRRRDGVGDLLEIGGIRTDRHRLNPVVLFDHGKALALPIAKAEDPDTHEYTVYLDPQTQSATCKAFFYQGGENKDHAVFCEQLFDLVAKRYVRAGSIGFTVVMAKELPPNYETGTPKGLHLIAVNMLEASIVVMPANQDTVRKALSLNRVCGKALSPMLVKSLSPYAGERKAQLGYEAKGADTGKLKRELERIYADCSNRETDETKGGIGVWYASDGSGVFIDVRDWGDGELGEEIGNVAAAIVGQDAVEFGNEQSPPKGREWIKIKSFDATVEEAAKVDALKHKLPHVRKGMHQCGKCRKRFYTEVNAKGCCGANEVRLRSVRRKSMCSTCGMESCTCPVPTGDLSKTKIPPAKWKPGVGAEKSVAMASNRTTTGFQVGDSVAARDYLFRWDGPKRIQFAKPGDRLRVVDVVQEGLVKVQNNSGDVMELTGSSVRKKEMYKDLSSIRLKYRKSKSVRRRLKKSAPGSSMVYLSGKDLKAAKEMAEAKGLKFARVGVKGELEKVKLSGDDDAIDQVAKQYGKPLRGLKHMAVTKTKEIRLVQKKKDLDDTPIPGDEAIDQPIDDADGVQEGIDIPPERYSAQVGRRVHECFRILMAELDAMMGPLENDEYKSFVENILGVCEETLTEAETLHGKHHSDLAPLDGAMGKDMDEMDSEDSAEEGAEDAVDDKDLDGADTNVVPADSVSDDPDDDTTDEEVAQAMMDKALARVPSIRLKTRKKFFASSNKSALGPCKSESENKALTEEEVGDIKEEINTQATDTEADPIEESTSAEGKGMLKAHELAQCKGATHFLKEVGETSDWDDEWRMKSYHYHKVLDEIGTSDPTGVQPVDSLNGGPSADNSDAPGNKNLESDNDEFRKEFDDTEMDTHPHRKMCKNCSGFLGKLAHEKAFGDAHREQAMLHHKELDGMATSYDQQADLPDMPEEPQQEETSQEDVPIGDVQEKKLRGIEATLSRLESLLSR